MSNWFTEQPFSNVSEEKRIVAVGKLEDMCEHVSEHPEMLYMVSRENDSFGVVGEYGMCQACYRKMRDDIDSKEVTCHDCGNVVLKKNTISWKWYDFYAPQGDEPMIICHDCRVKDKHKRRIIQDRHDYESEMGSYSHEDCDDY